MQRKTSVRPTGKILFNKRVNYNHPGNSMKLMNDLFFTDYGLMSIIGILMMIVGTVGAAVIIKRKMNEEPAPPPGSK